MHKNLRNSEVYDRLMAKKTRAARIRAKCLDCCVYQPGEVRMCPSKDCPLWIFRSGHKREE